MGLPIPHLSCVRNHTVHGLLCLTPVTECDVFQARPCCSTCPCFTPVPGSVIFQQMGSPHFMSPFLSQWTFGSFPPFGCWELCCPWTFLSSFCLNFVQVSQNILHFQQQGTKLSFLHMLPSTASAVFFFFFVKLWPSYWVFSGILFGFGFPWCPVDIGLPFKCFLAICDSPSGEMSIQMFNPFLIRLFVLLLLSYRSYAFWTLDPYQSYDLQISSPFCRLSCLFLLIASFDT